MAYHPFWSAQCPGRGAGLTHAHWDRCADQHGADQCCHCEGRPTDDTAPLDVVARLTALGFMTPLSPEQKQEAEDVPDEDIREAVNIHEPQMRSNADSLGPTGPAWERGRSWYGDGGLNPRDIPRLNDVIWRENTRGYR